MVNLGSTPDQTGPEGYTKTPYISTSTCRRNGVTGNRTVASSSGAPGVLDRIVRIDGWWQVRVRRGRHCSLKLPPCRHVRVPALPHQTTLAKVGPYLIGRSIHRNLKPANRELSCLAARAWCQPELPMLARGELTVAWVRSSPANRSHHSWSP